MEISFLTKPDLMVLMIYFVVLISGYLFHPWAQFTFNNFKQKQLFMRIKKNTILVSTLLLTTSYKPLQAGDKKVVVYAIESLARRSQTSAYFNMLPVDSLFFHNTWGLEKIVGIRQVQINEKIDTYEDFKGYHFIDLVNKRFLFIKSIPEVANIRQDQWSPLSTKRQGKAFDFESYHGESYVEKDTMLEQQKRRLIRYYDADHAQCSIILGNEITDSVYFSNIERKLNRRVLRMSFIEANGSESLTKIHYSILTQQQHPVQLFFNRFKGI